MTGRLVVVLALAVLVGLMLLAGLAFSEEAGNTFSPAGCVYNADRREWVCPSPGRGSLQAPGEGVSGADAAGSASSGSGAGAGAGASGGGASSGSCK